MSGGYQQPLKDKGTLNNGAQFSIPVGANQPLDSYGAMGGGDMGRLPQLASMLRERQAANSAPMAASGAPQIPVAPRDPILQGVSTAYGGSSYVDPANVPAGQSFKVGAAPTLGGMLRNHGRDLNVRSNGDGTVTLLPPEGWSPNWSNKSVAERNAIRGQKAEQRASLVAERNGQDTFQNRREGRLAAMLNGRGPAANTGSQASINSRQLGTQGLLNRQNLLNSEIAASVKEQFPDGVTNVRDSQSHANSVATSLHQQVVSGQRTWEDALRQAEIEDRQRMASGIGVNGASVASVLQQFRKGQDWMKNEYSPYSGAF